MTTNSNGFQVMLRLADAAATARLGAQIAAGLRPGDAVALTGDLGAGKTALARAILESLGVSESVPSPTFTIVQHYEADRFPVWHYDLYRIEDAHELAELGMDEALDQGVVLIEWPEKADDVLPDNRLHVRLTIAGETARDANIAGPLRWSRHISAGSVHAT